MKKMSLVTAGLLATLSFTAYAGHLGGAGGGKMDGMAANHMSSMGMQNTNGPAAADRDKGLARAEDRRSAEAGMHEQADTAKGHNKMEKSGKHKSH